MITDLNHRLVLAKQLPKQAIALILAGGRGTRLKDLTTIRAKPALHFGGKFRIIDFTLSNCFNSGIQRIGVLTQYNSHSLVRHIQRGWSFFNENADEFIDFLPAQQRFETGDWYKGTADAIYQNLDIIHRYNAKYIVILAGDHIYKMDYSLLLLDHFENNSACTVACIEVPLSEAHQYGIMDIDNTRKITQFTEKPKKAKGLKDKPDTALASMGIYVFNADYLYDLLEKDRLTMESAHDFGRDLIPRAVAAGCAFAHPFELSCVRSDVNHPPYWRDVGTLDSYWQANLDLAFITPQLDIYDQSWPIRTTVDYAPPAKFVQDRSGLSGQIMNSLVTAGVIISGSMVVNSILFPKVRVNSFCTIDSCVILPEVNVGRSCRLRRCIVDRGCKIPEGLVIGEDPELDSLRFVRSEKGVIVVTKEMLSKL